MKAYQDQMNRKADERGIVSSHNAPAHKSLTSMATVHDCGLNLLISFPILLNWPHLVINCYPAQENT